MDAGAFGARLGPRDAYRFARGEQVTSSTGQPVKLSRPLDFLVVADHSDNMGFFPDLFAGKPELLADPTGRKWYDMIQSGKGAEAAIEIIVAFSQGTFPKDLMYFPGTRAYRGAWQETIAAAEHYNEPGRFTAFIGYEWTSNTGGNNLHRNVIFRDNGDKASQVEPFTVYPPFGSDNPVELWKWMEAYEKKTGGSVLAIAHNGNLSNGLMFPIVEAFGKKLDREYAETAREVGAALRGDADQGRRRGASVPLAERRVRRLRALGQGQPRRQRRQEEGDARVRVRPLGAARTASSSSRTLGTNPYKFGLIGSSDAHTGLAAMEEDNFFGKTTPQEPSPHRMTATFINNAEDRREDHGLGGRLLRLRRRVGQGEHPRVAVGRHAAQGDLRDHRPAHGRALLRRLGLRGEGCAQPPAGARSATPRACRWAATCARRRRARRRRSSSPR